METDNDREHRAEGRCCRPECRRGRRSGTGVPNKSRAHIPGRLRFRSAALKGAPRAGEIARARLSRIKGVTSVAANPITGSLLVEYDPATLAPTRVIDALSNHGYVAAAEEQRTRGGGGWADRLASAVGGWIIDALAERLVWVMIGALA